jgi:hypothetical protein
MTRLLRDVLLSFCPAAARRDFPPVSPLRTLRAATWGGLAQFFLATFALVVRFKAYFAMRTHQLAPHIGGTSEITEAGIVVFITLEFVIHPLSLFLLYLAVEGLVRFAGGLITAEVLPSFLVFLGFKIAGVPARARERHAKAALPPDTLEFLPDGRIRIASAQARPAWNASITIGVNAQWFEVERTERGAPPRSHVYLLRPSPPGKVLRGYEEYSLACALVTGPVSTGPDGPSSPIEK